MTTGWGLVCLGILYIANTLISLLGSTWLQTRRLASEERQAVSAANATVTGNINTKVK